MLSGAMTTLWLLGGTRYVGAIGLDIHTMLVSGVFALIGYELLLFGAFIKVFGMRAGFLPSSRRTDDFFRVATLEKGLLLGGALTVTGFALVLFAVVSWGQGGYGALDTQASMRPLIVAVLLIAAGVQTIFASFVLSMLGIRDNVVVRPSDVLEPDLEMRDVTGVGQRRPTNGSSNGSHHRP
jgi:hypothetical protein